LLDAATALRRTRASSRVAPLLCSNTGVSEFGFERFFDALAYMNDVIENNRQAKGLVRQGREVELRRIVWCKGAGEPVLSV
jgi:hypothetical protein